MLGVLLYLRMEKVDLRNNHLGNLMSNKGIRFAFMGEEHYIRSTGMGKIVYAKNSVEFKEEREAVNIAERLIKGKKLPFTDEEYDYWFEDGDWYRRPCHITEFEMKVDDYKNARDLGNISDFLIKYPHLKKIKLISETGEFIEDINI